jgi:hypothetical protein
MIRFARGASANVNVMAAPCHHACAARQPSIKALA